MRNLKPWQAFKNFAIIFSFVVNFILLLVLLIAGPLILPIVNDIVKPLVGGLSDSFVEMGDATIIRTIPVNDQIPIEFTLPLSQTTKVVLTENVPLAVNASFVLPGGGGTINGTVNINLPKGLPLPVSLNLNVPVQQTIPIALNVDVEIPMDETELGSPFERLQALFGPLDALLSGLPDDTDDLMNRIKGKFNANEPALPENAQIGIVD